MQLIVLGDVAVGKSSVVQRFIGRPFLDRIESTIAVDFFILNQSIGDEEFKVQIWDTAGSEQYRSLTKSYYRNAAAAVLVYSEAEPITFASLENIWIPELRKNNCPATHLLIIGNKLDAMEGDGLQVLNRELRRIGKGFRTTCCHMSAKVSSPLYCQDVIDTFCHQALLHTFKLAEKLESTDSGNSTDSDGFVEIVATAAYSGNKS